MTCEVEGCVRASNNEGGLCDYHSHLSTLSRFSTPSTTSTASTIGIGDVYCREVPQELSQGLCQELRQGLCQELSQECRDLLRQSVSYFTIQNHEGQGDHEEEGDDDYSDMPGLVEDDGEDVSHG